MASSAESDQKASTALVILIAAKDLLSNALLLAFIPL
jgi:hypothetical protein